VLNKLIPWNLDQILFQIIITSFYPCTCEGTENPNIERLELVGCMWWKREYDNIVFFCKLEELILLMGPMAIEDEENCLARSISLCCLWDKNVLEPLVTVEVTCPSIIR
jgi:hypothetical protein